MGKRVFLPVSLGQAGAGRRRPPPPPWSSPGALSLQRSHGLLRRRSLLWILIMPRHNNSQQTTANHSYHSLTPSTPFLSIGGGCDALAHNFLCLSSCHSAPHKSSHHASKSLVYRPLCHYVTPHIHTSTPTPSHSFCV